MTTTNNITTFTVNMSIYNNTDQTINPNTYIPTKVCSKCRTIKQLTKFFKDNKSNDGYKNQCKNCRRNYKKEYSEENKDKIV